MQPRVEDLMDQVDSKFTLVTLSAMRAREINDYYNQLGEGLGRIVPPQVTSVSRKPLSIALEEIDAKKIRYERIEPVEDAAESGEAAETSDAPADGGPDATA
jgi:DNA-directed RNA polymerase subunit omega